ncbi:MAG: acetolactate synthase [Actinomycetota bacterium]
MTEHGHGGRAASRALQSLGVSHLFTLSGGHIFPIYDGCKADGIRVVDVRHEQSAGFAAEGWARLTRSVGVCAVTAGPGVTNLMSSLAQAGANGAPVLALAGRAPAFRWGQGSLQEIDHVPFVDPLAPARTVGSARDVPAAVVDAAGRARSRPRGPVFLDFPLDVMYGLDDFEVPPPGAGSKRGPAPHAGSADGDIDRVAELIENSERPVLVAGSNVWLDRAEDRLATLVEAAGIPMYMNGQGRGCLPADHPLAFARSRSAAMTAADLVIVAGAPLDFRLGFGQGFASGARVVHMNAGPPPRHVELACPHVADPLDLVFGGIADGLRRAPDTSAWRAHLRTVEDSKRAAAQADLASTQVPIHPLRVYGELARVLERDAIVIGDGGDFVSFAGREVASYVPGAWLDPGPFGCLGCGPGYALAARLAHPDRQVVLLLGDGALGFSLAELETMVRLDLPVTCVVGNNGIWGLEKHPMRALYGYDMAADLQPGLRYDQVMEAFGGNGALVADPDAVGPALRRALDSGVPSLVNVVTDPEVAYPRASTLA